MKLKLTLGLALLVGSTLLFAQSSEADAIDHEQLQQQMEQARQDLAEAAQRMARLQRELIQSEGGTQAWVWKSQDGELQDLPLDLNIEVDADKVRHLAIAGFPPRLGVVLDDSGSDGSNRIVGVTPGSGAEQAGLRQDDRLVSIEGEDVTVDTSRRIRELLTGRAPGDSVDVTILRGDSNELIMPVTLGSALQDISMIGERMAPMMRDIEHHIIRVGPGQDAPVPPTPPGTTGLGHNTQLINNHPGLEAYFGTGDGVLVLRIAADNSLNLESGDVVLSVDGESVSRPVDLGRALISRKEGEEIILQVMRQGVLTDVYGSQLKPD